MCTDAQLDKEEDLKKVLRGDPDADKEKAGLASLPPLCKQVRILATK